MLDTTRTQALTAPGAVATAVWLDAWLAGRAGSDDLLTELARIAPDTPAGLHEGLQTQPAQALLQRIRGCAAASAWPVLPRPGRTLGWPTSVAADPCPAVLLVGRGTSSDDLPLQARQLLRAASGGWVLDDLRGEPAGGGAGRTESAPTDQRAAASLPASAALVSTSSTGAALGRSPEPVTALLADALGPRAASRRFAALLEEASADLAQLGLERAPRHPDSHRWASALQALPRTTDGALVALLERIGLILDALDQALREDGAAVTAGEARVRAARLRRLEGELTDLACAVVVGASVAVPDVRR